MCCCPFLSLCSSVQWDKWKHNNGCIYKNKSNIYIFISVSQLKDDIQIWLPRHLQKRPNNKWWHACKTLCNVNWLCLGIKYFCDIWNQIQGYFFFFRYGEICCFLCFMVIYCRWTNASKWGFANAGMWCSKCITVVFGSSKRDCFVLFLCGLRSTLKSHVKLSYRGHYFDYHRRQLLFVKQIGRNTNHWLSCSEPRRA